MSTKSKILGVMLLLVVQSVACGPPPASESLEGIEESCRMYYETLFYCPTRQKPGDTEEILDARVDMGTELCVSEADESAAIGDQCAESYAQAITCFAGLSCNEHDLRGMPEVYPCEGAINGVRTDCPGLWENADT